MNDTNKKEESEITLDWSQSGAYREWSEQAETTAYPVARSTREDNVKNTINLFERWDFSI